MIKQADLEEFIDFFGGNRSFFETFRIEWPESTLLCLNRDEEFESVFKLMKLQNTELDESVFFSTSLSKTLNAFPQAHYSGILGEQYSKVFLTVRRAQVKHLIKKFTNEILSKLPSVFVKVLQETQLA